ncbi:hypothetical protein QE250_09050 [Chromatiaceae bacterium AAb-1]|nr:hypothetical protein [Chromatiaceae bacterium AAb-1]
MAEGTGNIGNVIALIAVLLLSGCSMRQSAESFYHKQELFDKNSLIYLAEPVRPDNTVNIYFQARSAATDTADIRPVLATMIELEGQAIWPEPMILSPMMHTATEHYIETFCTMDASQTTACKQAVQALTFNRLALKENTPPPPEQMQGIRGQQSVRLQSGTRSFKVLLFYSGRDLAVFEVAGLPLSAGNYYFHFTTEHAVAGMQLNARIEEENSGRVIWQQVMTVAAG